MTTITETDSHGLWPVSRPTLAESVADAIRTSILNGRFIPGDRLVEAELARELNVSRGPIREALVLLHQDGIVVHEPRRVKFVQRFTPRLIDEVYSLRRLIEPEAAERLIERLDDSGRARLESALAGIATAAGDDDETSLARADVAFHNLIYQLADHDLLERAWLDNIAGRLRLWSNITTQKLDSLGDAEKNHRLLLDPMLAGDVAASRKRIEEHIDNAWELAREQMAGVLGT
jgi:DNA-binding GntR family transcriptional regulator